jgi:hypothetical protein
MATSNLLKGAIMLRDEAARLVQSARDAADLGLDDLGLDDDFMGKRMEEMEAYLRGWREHLDLEAEMFRTAREFANPRCPCPKARETHD